MNNERKSGSPNAKDRLAEFIQSGTWMGRVCIICRLLRWDSQRSAAPGGERGAAGPWYIRLLNRQEEEGKCLGPDIRPRGTHHPNKPTQLDQPLINGPQEIPKSVVGLIDWSQLRLHIIAILLLRLAQPAVAIHTWRDRPNFVLWGREGYEGYWATKKIKK